MDAWIGVIEQYGYLLMLLVGFAEFAGVPIAAVPVLITAGALARGGPLSAPLLAACTALGGLLADAGWYGAARRGGGRLVNAACSLSPDRSACVVAVEARVRQVGPRYLLFAKFIPGVGNLVAPAAGFAGMPTARFLAYDAAGLLLWAGAYAGAGWLFTDQVEAIVALAVRYARWILWIVLALVGIGAARRARKWLAHGHVHHRHGREGIDAAAS